MKMYRLKQRLHSSWWLAAWSMAVLAGVVMAASVSQTAFATVAWLLVGLALTGLVLWRRSVYMMPLIIVAGLLVGLWRGSIEQAQLATYKSLYKTSVLLTGKVSEDADIGKNDELVLRLDHIAVSGHALAGKVWVSSPTTLDIKRGDTVTVKGKLGTGFGNFAGTMYRATVAHVERPQPGDVARQVRDWFADSVRLAIAEPQASLGIGYLVGQRRALPEELGQALQIAGLTHVVVASGYNLTILVRLARRLFVKISKYLSALSASTMILGFMAITGASPSMARAGLVAGLALLAWYYGRKFHPLVLLPCAAAATALISPGYLWGDLGWQLSFAAFGGVMILAPLLQAYFFGKEKPGFVQQILGETVSAQIATLPILILAFGKFSNVAVIANLLVLPLVPLAMLLTFIAGIGSLIAPQIAWLFGLPGQALLTYMTSVAEFMAKQPWAQTDLQINGWIATGMYVALGLACVYLWRVTKLNLRDTNIVE